MRRLIRHIRTLCWALSLLACVVLASLWVRSYWSASTLAYTRFDVTATDAAGAPTAVRRTMYEFASMSGHLVAEHSDMPVEYEQPGGRRWPPATWRPPAPTLSVYGQHDYLRRRPAQTFLNRLGFHHMTDPGAPGRLSRYIVPTWSVALLLFPPTALVTLRRVQKHRAARRAQHGLCPTCGYDLRVQLALGDRSESKGHAAGQRCPECGTENLGRASAGAV